MNEANPQEGAINSVQSVANAIEGMAEVSEETSENVAQEETMETTEEVTEEVTDEVEDEPTEDSTEDSESDETEAETADTFESLSDLAEALEMPFDDFMASIKSTVKINGEEKEVTLADLKNGYQMEADYRRKTADLAEQRKAFEQEQENTIAEYQAKLQQVELLSSNLENQLLEEFNSIDWQGLEATDREEWLVQRQKYGEKYQQIQNIKQQAQGELEHRKQLSQQQQQAEYQKYLQEQGQKMFEVIPEWNNPEVFEKEQSEIRNLLNQYGFSDQEVEQISDHRVVKLIHDAMKLKTLDKKVDLTKQKVKKLPKIVRPGNKQTKQELATNKKSEATKKFYKTGSRDDLVAALIERSN